MRRAVLALVVLVAVLGSAAWLATRRDVAPAEAPAPAQAGFTPGPGSALASAAPAPAPARAPALPPDAAPASPAPLQAYPVDLEQLREVLPENLYWAQGAPTADPEVAKARAERAKALNALYGKVLSGTGTDDELSTYFEEKQREHEDAIRFARTALEAGGDRLPERDRSLLLFAIELHEARLEELPARREEARARKAEQDRRRAEWRAAGSPVPP